MATIGCPPTYPSYDFPGIYQILNLVDGKRYVGQAQQIGNRLREHRRSRNGDAACQASSHLYRAVRRYGWESFEASVLERLDDLSLLDEREAFWISMLDACNRDKGYNIRALRDKGYNIRALSATMRGWRHTDEALDKMRAAAQGRVGARNPFYGKHHTAEAKARNAAAHRGKATSDAQKAATRALHAAGKSGRSPIAVRQVDPVSSGVVRVWPSISDAARQLGLSQGSITGCCQGKPGRKTAGGWRWEYPEG